jgi:O-methyltransferase
MNFIIALVAICCAILLLRHYYYTLYMKKCIFPFYIEDIRIPDLKKDQYYNAIVSRLPRTPSQNELEFLLQYKHFTESKDTYSMANKSEVQFTHDILYSTRHVKGDIAEFGVWKGGMAMWMKNLMNYYSIPKNLYLFDTFGEFPSSDQNKKDSEIHPITEYLFASEYNIIDNFKKFNLLDDNVKFLVGEFQETVPNTKIDRLSVLRLDCDYYEPTMLILESYYKTIVKNGVIIIDDYNNPYLGCKQAVDDFRKKYNIKNKIVNYGHGCVYWTIDTMSFPIT